jgi:hypothetical protein
MYSVQNRNITANVWPILVENYFWINLCATSINLYATSISILAGRINLCATSISILASRINLCATSITLWATVLTSTFELTALPSDLLRSLRYWRHPLSSLSLLSYWHQHLSLFLYRPLSCSFNPRSLWRHPAGYCELLGTPELQALQGQSGLRIHSLPLRTVRSCSNLSKLKLIVFFTYDNDQRDIRCQVKVSV